MRLLILLPGNDVGGAERAAAQVAMAALGRGHDVLVGTPAPHTLAFGLEELPYQRMALHPERKWEAPQAVTQIRRVKADVVYTYHRWPTLLAGASAATGGAPVVNHAQTMVGKRRGTWWGHRTIAVSEDMRRHVVRCGADPARTIVVRNGALPRDLPSQGLRTPGRLVAAARMVPGKGLEHLIRAMQELPEMSLEVLGDGPHLPNLQSLVDTLGLGPQIKFFGWHPDPWQIFVRAALGVVPTDTYPEGLPLTAAEMMMAGLPLVVTDVPGLREVADGRTVLLTPPGDPGALAAAIRHGSAAASASLRRDVHSRARQQFNAARSSRTIVEVIEAMSEKKP